VRREHCPMDAYLMLTRTVSGLMVFGLSY
jgi:hypothetical protein